MPSTLLKIKTKTLKISNAFATNKIKKMDIKDKLDALELKELMEELFLPKLKYDLDSVPIENELFVVYQESIEKNLPLLFDLFHQFKQTICENEEFFSTFLLLMCELAPDTIYRIKNDRLIQQVHRVLVDQQPLTQHTENRIFDYYKEKLKQDVWKKNMGAIHGFSYFLEHVCIDKVGTAAKLEGKWLNFALAVALNIRDCHEETYKQLGIDIFHSILVFVPPADIRDMNLHSVIYDSVVKDVHFLDDVSMIKNVWNCVLMCLDYFENIDSLNWCQVDDLMDILMSKIPFTKTGAIAACLIDYVTKLCIYFTINRAEIQKSIDGVFVDVSTLDDCCQVCSSITSYTNYRWAKAILEMITFESYKLLHNVDTCLELLTAMHKCYFAAMLPIQTPIAEPHLIVFYEKFTAVLMEAIAAHKKHKSVIELTSFVIDTYIWQLQRTPSNQAKGQLATFLSAFEKLRQNEIFS